MTDDLPAPATVYGLKSTRDNRLRYIGQTQGEPSRRYYRHMHDARCGAPGKVAAWIRNEVAAGFTIRQTILVEHGILNETERAVIERARATGYDLLNVHNGGGTGKDGRIGKAPSDKTRRKMSAAGRGRRHAPETKAKLSASHGHENSWHFPDFICGGDNLLDHATVLGNAYRR